MITALLKVDFGSRSHSRVPDFYSTFVKKSTLKSALLDFKSGKSDLDWTPPLWFTPSPKPYLVQAKENSKILSCTLFRLIQITLMTDFVVR